jgi:putative hydrolase of HD superfamily
VKPVTQLPSRIRGASIMSAPLVETPGIMQETLSSVVTFLNEIERLKLVSRKSYVSDLSRHENSAEHSWHLAIGLLTVAHELNLQLDLHRALVMALIHDLCEIDAGDTPLFGPDRPD